MHVFPEGEKVIEEAKYWKSLQNHFHKYGLKDWVMSYITYVFLVN